MTTASQRVRYRRLPGRRRGFFRSHGVWLGPDHLLAVWNFRFREEYKRFHLRDVQAIAIANAPRFHISTRSVLIASIWLFLYVVLRNYRPWSATAFWTVAAVLVVAWIYISSACSCRCQIYTAVSRDELPSVYRTWTARLFLAQVEERIIEVQGKLDESLPLPETGTAGPPLGALPDLHAEAGVAAPRQAPARTLFSDILLTVLFADALTNYLTLHSTTRIFQWLMYGFNFIEVAAATAVLVQYHRKVIRVGMQRLGVVTLSAIGILYYLRPLLAGIMAGVQSTPQKQVFSVDPNAFMSNLVFREIDIGVTLALAVAGLVIIGFSKDS